MNDGNTMLSAEAQVVIKRVRELQEVYLKTGFLTRAEQQQALLTLHGEDLRQAIEQFKLEGLICAPARPVSGGAR
jgi:hypothetical protein